MGDNDTDEVVSYDAWERDVENIFKPEFRVKGSNCDVIGLMKRKGRRENETYFLLK